MLVVYHHLEKNKYRYSIDIYLAVSVLPYGNIPVRTCQIRRCPQSNAEKNDETFCMWHFWKKIHHFRLFATRGRYSAGKFIFFLTDAFISFLNLRYSCPLKPGCLRKHVLLGRMLLRKPGCLRKHVLSAKIKN